MTSETSADELKVVIVMLRKPYRDDPEERRDDPFWEFGSFGCTRCHRRNLMNPKRAHELVGNHFAFAQGGDKGVRLVHVAFIASIRKWADRVEAIWHLKEMPLTYNSAPILVDNLGHSNFPLIEDEISRVKRPTPVSRFASAFRTRRLPLAGEIGSQILAGYRSFRASAEVAASYEQALPYLPPKVETDRSSRYKGLLASLNEPK